MHSQLVEQQELTPCPAEAYRVDCSSGSLVVAADQYQLYSVDALVPLKGIDVLANKRYRVQLNAFMKDKDKVGHSYSCKKFSRNSVDLYEVGVVSIYYRVVLRLLSCLLYSHLSYSTPI